MLFNLFGKKEYPLGTEQYEFSRTVGEEHFTILVDMKYEEAFLLRKTHADMIVVAFTVEDSTKKIDSIASALKDLTKKLQPSTKAVFVGLVQGEKVIIGYILADKAVSSVEIESFLDTKVPHTITRTTDPDWVFIQQTLFPSDSERQRVSNASLIRLIAVEQGDNATPPKGVEHTVSFKNMESVSGFSQEIELLGYSRGAIHNTQDKVFPFSLVFYKDCVVTIGEVDTETDSLIVLAEKYTAKYEGWQAMGVHTI